MPIVYVQGIGPNLSSNKLNRANFFVLNSMKSDSLTDANYTNLLHANLIKLTVNINNNRALQHFK